MRFLEVDVIVQFRAVLSAASRQCRQQRTRGYCFLNKRLHLMKTLILKENVQLTKQ